MKSCRARANNCLPGLSIASKRPHQGQVVGRALLALAATAGSACATDNGSDGTDLVQLPLEQLLNLDVYSASKFAQKVSEAPSAVSVVTAADIKSFGWRTLADILRSMRGLYVGYDRNYSYLGARGFLRPGDYNTRFQIGRAHV